MPFVSVEQNNAWFGEDSFNETGNHNLLVNLLNELAIERGAKSVFFNANLLDSPEDEFTFWMTPEAFFDQSFWYFFEIAMYSLWFYLTFNIAIGFVDRSKGID